ncbi:MAG: hypothetical protein M1836_007240 [Candelina mexicana]|nr:MAG: hypothetical protein M1836_007240 [Candelina mexicana]
MAGSQKRIGRELAEITNDPPGGVSVKLSSESDLFKWDITLQGPDNSPYAVRTLQGGIFKLLLVIPTDYPFKPPALNFQTKIYHPNVTNDEKGSMCLGMLRSDEWKPTSKLAGVLLAAKNILAEPNPDDAVETSIAEQYKTDRKDFDKTAKDWVKRYAKK